MGMEEKRKSRRIDLESHIVIKRIDNGIEDYVKIGIQDLSRSGVGFVSVEDLELDAVYESHITIWTKEVIHVLLKIARKVKQEDGYLYGAIFMGLSEVDAFRIEVYDAMDRELHKKEEDAKEAAAVAGITGAGKTDTTEAE